MSAFFVSNNNNNMIHIKTGNVLDIPTGVIVHGCNSRGVMASGIAKEVKERFPRAFDVYHCAYSTAIAGGAPGLPMGSFTVAEVAKDKFIVNLITQENYGRDQNVQYVDYDAVYAGFGEILKCKALCLSADFGNDLNFPRIGCGLGNGDWDVISVIIDEVIPDQWVTKNLWLFGDK